jgi:ANTAR domain
MERHAIDEHRAFELLRDHSRRTGRKLIDVAHATAEMHTLLPGTPRPVRPVEHHGESV